MNAGGLSYFSSGSVSIGLPGGVCPEAVAIAAIETSKIDRQVANIVDDLIKCEVVEALKRTRFLISDS